MPNELPTIPSWRERASKGVGEVRRWSEMRALNAVFSLRTVNALPSVAIV